ncbi:hypothetical protein [Thiolapillus sp.]|uniref:hypothetical protein n=1 Tax=Thiolapillus sp. TaxID=2017437 RepID=UPI003AF8C641
MKITGTAILRDYHRANDFQVAAEVTDSGQNKAQNHEWQPNTIFLLGSTSNKYVIPAQARICNTSISKDPGLHRGDKNTIVRDNLGGNPCPNSHNC